MGPLIADSVPLEVTLDGDDVLTVELDDRALIGLDVDISTPHAIDVDPYEGEYEVTPSLQAQYFDTKDKILRKSMTIHQIPVVYTSNPYNGKTVVIG